MNSKEKKADGLNWTSDSSGARSAFRSEAEEWSRKAEPRIARFLPVRLVREGKNGPKKKKYKFSWVSRIS